MNVTDIRLLDRDDGLLVFDIEFAGEFDENHLEEALVRTVDSKHVQASSIRVRNVTSNVATVEIATDGSENPTTVANRMLHSMQLNTAQTPVGAASANQSESENATSDVPGYGIPEEGVSYYQIDFVRGEPIRNLDGSEGTYGPDTLIRYAHGSTENLLKRSSNGEFTTDEKLAEAVESSAIVVKSDGTARVSFSIKEGSEPITLSLVSYTKPGPIWTRASESEQEFVDADTRTFKPGGTYTLRVDLPPVEEASDDSDAPETDEPAKTETEDTSESTSSSSNSAGATTTASPPPETATATETVEVRPDPTPTMTPTPTPATSEPATSTAESAGADGSEPPASTPTESATSEDESPATSAGSATTSATSAANDTPTTETQAQQATDEPATSSDTVTPSPSETDSEGANQPADAEQPTDGDATAPTASTPTEESTDEPPATTTETDSEDTPSPTESSPSEPSTRQPTSEEPTETATSTSTPTDEPATETEQPETDTETPEPTDKPTTEQPTTTETETEETPTSTESPTTETPTEKPTTTETQTETDEPTTTTETGTETATPTETETDTATPTETTTATSTPTPTPEPTTETETETETEETDTGPTPTTTPEPSESGAEISFNDQSLEEALRVVVESATITNENGGFVVVYDADSFGDINRPNDRVGISNHLSKGTTESINIDLQSDELVANDRLTAVVVNDTNGNGRYDPGVDMGALTTSGEIATDSANVAIAAGLLPGGPGDTLAPTENESDGNGSDGDDGGGILDVAATSEGSEATESETTAVEEPAARDAETTSADDGDESETPNASTTVNEAMAVSEATAPK